MTTSVCIRNSEKRTIRISILQYWLDESPNHMAVSSPIVHVDFFQHSKFKIHGWEQRKQIWEKKAMQFHHYVAQSQLTVSWSQQIDDKVVLGPFWWTGAILWEMGLGFCTVGAPAAYCRLTKAEGKKIKFGSNHDSMSARMVGRSVLLVTTHCNL